MIKIQCIILLIFSVILTISSIKMKADILTFIGLLGISVSIIILAGAKKQSNNYLKNRR